MDSILVADEVDCLAVFERTLEERGVLARAQIAAVRARWAEEIAEKARRVREELPPSPESLLDFVYAERA